jgi:hypothetical protein
VSTVSPKVSAAALAAACVGVLVWGLSAFADVNLPVEVQAALITVAVFAAGYLKTDPNRS